MVGGEILESSSDLDSRKILLKVASKIFAEKGFDGTSVREIADQAGVNISLISYHFGGKEGLYRGIIQNFADWVAKDIDSLLEVGTANKLSSEKFLNVIQRLVEKAIQAHTSHPNEKAILEHEVVRLMPLSRDLFENCFNRAGKKVGDFVQLAQNQNLVRKDVDPHALVLMIIFIVDKVFQASRCQTNIGTQAQVVFRDPAMLKDQILKIFLEGIIAK